MKAFIKVVRSSKDIYLEMRPRAFSFLLDLLLMEERCFSKLSSKSIMIPSTVSDIPVVSEDVTYRYINLSFYT